MSKLLFRIPDCHQRMHVSNQLVTSQTDTAAYDWNRKLSSRAGCYQFYVPYNKQNIFLFGRNLPSWMECIWYVFSRTSLWPFSGKNAERKGDTESKWTCSRRSRHSFQLEKFWISTNGRLHLTVEDSDDDDDMMMLMVTDDLSWGSFAKIDFLWFAHRNSNNDNLFSLLRLHPSIYLRAAGTNVSSVVVFVLIDAAYPFIFGWCAILYTMQ